MLEQGIPNGLVDLAIGKAGLTGFFASSARWALFEALSMLTGGLNVKVTDLSCGDFKIGQVHTQYCPIFLIGGGARHVGAKCVGQYAIDLPAPLNTLGTVYGEIVISVERESEVTLLKLDLQAEEPFTPRSICKLDIRPGVQMTMTTDLIARIQRAERQQLGGSVSTEAAQNSYLQQLTSAVTELLEKARQLVAAAASCAAGVRGGEMDRLLGALSNATVGIVDLDPAVVCPKVPDLLCQHVIRPQLQQGVGKVWSILNESVFDVSYMKYILLVAALLALPLTHHLVSYFVLVLSMAADAALAAKDAMYSVYEQSSVFTNSKPGDDLPSPDGQNNGGNNDGKGDHGKPFARSSSSDRFRPLEGGASGSYTSIPSLGLSNMSGIGGCSASFPSNLSAMSDERGGGLGSARDHKPTQHYDEFVAPHTRRRTICLSDSFGDFASILERAGAVEAAGRVRAKGEEGRAYAGMGRVREAVGSLDEGGRSAKRRCLPRGEV